MTTPPTIDTMRRDLAARFAAHGIETPALDARLLMEAALDLDLTGLAVQAGRVLTTTERQRLDGFAKRRLAGEPVARITGQAEFWTHRLKLGPDTLVPRADTETAVEAALAQFPDRRAALRVADFGTGSGALLIALLSEYPNAQGTGTDLSAATLAIARANAVACGVITRAAFVSCDYGAALRGPFDLIVSNPPYIPTPDLDGLDREVRDHDPRLALDGGADGLAGYRRIAEDAVKMLSPSGALIVELGIGQAEDVSGVFAHSGLETQAIRPDLAGIPRALTATLQL